VCARVPVGIPSPSRGGRWKPRSRAMLGTVEATKAGCDIRATSSRRESHVQRVFRKQFMYSTGAKISRSARPLYFFKTRYYEDIVPFGGMGPAFSGVCGGEEGTHGSLDAGVGAGGGKPRSSARGYGARSTSSSLLTSSRPKGSSTTLAMRRLSRRKVMRGLAAEVRRTNRRRKSRYGGFE
jgi:hypothetical protein